MQCKERLHDLVSTADQFGKARLLAAQTKHSGAWLKAVPSQNVGTLLTPDVLRIAIALRLGCYVCENSICRCGKRIDKLGLHGLSCRINAGRFPRHTEINSIIHKALNKANVPSILEPTGLSRQDGKRPDGLTICPWTHGRCLAWDVTVTDTFCETNIMDSATTPSAAANKSEKLKIEKYRNLPDTINFQPLAFETTGTMGHSTLNFVTALGRRLRAISGDARETKFLAERISLAIIRGNAASVTGCFH
jgi:hypothetical protein